MGVICIDWNSMWLLLLCCCFQVLIEISLLYLNCTKFLIVGVTFMSDYCFFFRSLVVVAVPLSSTNKPANQAHFMNLVLSIRLLLTSM